MAMEKNILAINAGSSSKKYAVFAGEVRVCSAHFEKSVSGFDVSYDGGSATAADENLFRNALAAFLTHAKEMHAADIGAVGLRVVAVGRQFNAHALIDASYEAQLSREAERDPDHTPLVLAELAQVRELLPNVPVVASSDSAFHRSLSDVAKRYALPQDVVETSGIERTGFHGLSVASAASELEKLLGSMPERAVVCHLGSGASVTALKNGQSVDTSMGYSPLSGIPMSTRPGELDAEAVLRLIGNDGVEATKEMLYRKSGLLALSGLSDDMRVLLEAEAQGDEHAAFAINSFAYHVKKYIGAYAAVLGGLDALVFSGTIGIRSAPIRRRVTNGLTQLGIELDQSKNDNAVPSDDISSGPVKIFVLKTDEESEVAKAVVEFL
jgi:acetate kinase